MGSEQRVLALASDAAFIASLGLTVPSLEGYLFPDTYHVTRDVDEASLLTLMARTFERNYTPEIAAKAEELGLSRHAVVTLASLIEKEAQLDSERELIAAVFHNRLRRGMRLQCDSTVIYALGEAFDGGPEKGRLADRLAVQHLPPCRFAARSHRQSRQALARRRGGAGRRDVPVFRGRPGRTARTIFPTR